jgi:hypothetical protein
VAAAAAVVRWIKHHYYGVIFAVQNARACTFIKIFACALPGRKHYPVSGGREARAQINTQPRANAAAAPDAMMLFARLPQDTCNINF